MLPPEVFPHSRPEGIGWALESAPTEAWPLFRVVYFRVIFTLVDERGATVPLTMTRPNPISIEEWVKKRVARLERRTRFSPPGVCQETVKNLETLLWMMLVNLTGTPTTVDPP